VIIREEKRREEIVSWLCERCWTNQSKESEGEEIRTGAR
jgi:hypothetical protein